MSTGIMSAKVSNPIYSHAGEYPCCVTKYEKSNGGTKSPIRAKLLTQLTDSVSYSGLDLFAALAAEKPKVNPAPEAKPTRIPDRIAE